jgi:hypothetical protein
MVIPDVKQQMLADLARMTPDMQRLAAELVHSMVPAERKGTSGRELLRFAGAIDRVSAKEMSDAINAGCGQIELDEW